MIKYDPHNWIDHFFDIQGSLVREISGRVALITLWSVFVIVFHLHVHAVGIAPTVHSLVGIALGLLLVFRTNASYDRFWEGRKLWGGIVNESRNLARQCESFLKNEPEFRREMGAYIVGYVYATMHKLRGQSDVGPLRSYFSEESLAPILRAQHFPVAIAKQMSLVLQKAKVLGLISEYAQVALDQNIQLLVDYLGACERIHSTPLPFAYVVHLRRALIIYCLTLPFALVDAFGYLSIVALFLVAYIFFGIEEIGVETEDPFGDDFNDLPLEAICGNIQKNIEEVISVPLRFDLNVTQLNGE